jgi:hypothetical protein
MRVSQKKRPTGVSWINPITYEISSKRRKGFKKDPVVWITADKRELRIHEISDAHLKSIIKLLINKRLANRIYQRFDAFLERDLTFFKLIASKRGIRITHEKEMKKLLWGILAL